MARKGWGGGWGRCKFFATSAGFFRRKALPRMPKSVGAATKSFTVVETN